MNEYRSSLLFLILNLFSNLSYEKELTNLTIQHVCENDLLVMKCLNINETIQIVRSMYGRTSQRICNNDLGYRSFEKTCANIDQSKKQMKSFCQGKSTCQIFINNQLFNDPCGLNIPKHFEIHYRCINKEEICSKLTENCSKSNDVKCIEKIQDELSCQCPSTICRYVNNQIIGFIENHCSDEYLQGISWMKTFINKTAIIPCPSPCTGQIFRYCTSNSQWSEPNYTNCHCPIEQSDQLSTHYSATSYVFQCNFWLINRILPKDKSCIFSLVNSNSNHSLDCLLNVFKQTKFQLCYQFNSLGINFNNIDFEIFIPNKNQSHFRLLLYNQFNEIIIDRTDIIKENFRENLPMMIIDTKNMSSTNRSFILIEQENDLNSIQTANVTIIFNHQSSEIRYQCRAYHSTNFSSSFDSLNMFFACQLLCSNGSHVICQCPFFNPFMHYVLHIDKSTKENDVRIDNDLNGRCFDGKNNSIKEDMNKLDRYLKDISSINFAKKIFIFIDKLISKENIFLNWKIIQQINDLAFKLINKTHSFTSINSHIDFFLKSNEYQFENYDRSVSILIIPKQPINLDFQFVFYTIFNENIQPLFNSRLVNLNFLSKNVTIDNIQIIYRHLTPSTQHPTCAYLKTNENFFKNDIQLNTDGCQLLSTNSTHSICLCKQMNTFGLVTDFEKPIMKSNQLSLLFISKIASIISIVCLLLTIIILMLSRSYGNMNDDLTTVRNILHTNILLCLIILQILFLFGIDQIKHKVYCRIVSILFDYFLLATFSWMFIDGIELLIALKYVFKIDRIRLIAYACYSYGFPLLFIFLSIGFSTQNGDYLNKFCWLSYDNGFIWAFITPFTLLILGNLCLFFISIYSLYKKSNSTEHRNYIKSSLRNTSLLSIQYGLTWVIALFYLSDEIILFGYLFPIFNSLNGLFILILYCLLQKPFRDFLNLTYLKSLQHLSLTDNSSHSVYSSGNSSDMTNKQMIDSNYTKNLFVHDNIDRQICLNNNNNPPNETVYLPSIPINLLTNRLSTFRYSLPSNEKVLSLEQNQQLIDKTRIHDDDHQYYEIR